MRGFHTDDSHENAGMKLHFTPAQIQTAPELFQSFVFYLG
jgi:hypothetical protein